MFNFIKKFFKTNKEKSEIENVLLELESSKYVSNSDRFSDGVSGYTGFYFENLFFNVTYGRFCNIFLVDVENKKHMKIAENTNEGLSYIPGFYDEYFIKTCKKFLKENEIKIAKDELVDMWKKVETENHFRRRLNV